MKRIFILITLAGAVVFFNSCSMYNFMRTSANVEELPSKAADLMTYMEQNNDFDGMKTPEDAKARVNGFATVFYPYAYKNIISMSYFLGLTKELTPEQQQNGMVFLQTTMNRLEATMEVSKAAGFYIANIGKRLEVINQKTPITDTIKTYQGLEAVMNELVQTTKGQNTRDGFLLGVWHGFRSPVIAIGGFFDKSWTAYSYKNSGLDYLGGFLLGIFLLLGVVGIFMNGAKQTNQEQEQQQE